jgi:hypothetical protein
MLAVLNAGDPILGFDLSHGGPLDARFHGKLFGKAVLTAFLWGGEGDGLD